MSAQQATQGARGAEFAGPEDPRASQDLAGSLSDELTASQRREAAMRRSLCKQEALLATQQEEYHALAAQALFTSGRMERRISEGEQARAKLNRELLAAEERIAALEEENRALRARAADLEVQATNKDEAAKISMTELASSLGYQQRLESQLKAIRAECDDRVAEYEARLAQQERELAQLSDQLQQANAELYGIHESRLQQSKADLLQQAVEQSMRVGGYEPAEPADAALIAGGAEGFSAEDESAANPELAALPVEPIGLPAGLAPYGAPHAYQDAQAAREELRALSASQKAAAAESEAATEASAVALSSLREDRTNEGLLKSKIQELETEASSLRAAIELEHAVQLDKADDVNILREEKEELTRRLEAAETLLRQMQKLLAGVGTMCADTGARLEAALEEGAISQNLRVTVGEGRVGLSW